MARVVANIYEDTRELLNRVKEEFQFKSDDQAIKYLCQSFMTDPRAETLRQYLGVKQTKE